MTQKLSVDIMRMLDHTEDKYPFTDWYDTKSAKSKGRYHRPVQGGLWMPVLAKSGMKFCREIKCPCVADSDI